MGKDKAVVVIYGNKSFLLGMQKFLFNRDIISYVYKYPTTHGLVISRKLDYVLTFLSLIYSNCEIKMERKYKKYLLAKDVLTNELTVS